MAITKLKIKPTILAAGAVYPYSDKLYEMGARITRYGEPYHLFRVIGAGDHKRILVPRNMAPDGTPNEYAEGLDCKFKSLFVPRNPEQKRVINESVQLIAQGESFLLSCPTGFGKCHPAGTKVIMYDGTLRAVEYIDDGDQLMGPDSKPRVVSGTTKHFDKIYRVTPTNGWEPFECNGAHVLSLKCVEPIEGHDKGDIINISILDYLNTSDEFKKATRLWRPNGIDLPPREVNDPYQLGKSLARVLMTGVVKRLPDSHVFNSRDVRVQLIAGLLDGADQGHELMVAGDYLKDQILWVARSVGIAATATEKDEVWVINLWGGLHYLNPSITDTKESPEDHLLSEFSVRYVRDGWVYGFELDQDHLYLLHDFTVTHNTACTMDIIAKVGKKTIVVVTKEDIRDQWIDAAKKFLGLEDKDIGVIQGDRFQVAGKKLVIAMIQSLAKEDRYPPHELREFGLMVLDEVHRVGADYFSQCCFRVPAALRLGLSATPERKDGRDEVIHAHIGVVKVRSEAAPLTPRIIVRRSPWKVPMTNVRQPDGSYRVGPVPHSPGKCGHVINMIANHHPRNELIAKFVGAAYKKGRAIIVQSDRKEHLETLALLIQRQGVPASDIGYYVGGMSQAQREKSKVKPVILSSYQMTAEATDIPWLDTLVMATPKSDVRQIVGRILRPYEGKQDPVVFDLVDDSSSVFQGYWNARMRWYRSIGAKVSLSSS